MITTARQSGRNGKSSTAMFRMLIRRQGIVKPRAANRLHQCRSVHATEASPSPYRRVSRSQKPHGRLRRVRELVLLSGYETDLSGRISTTPCPSTSAASSSHGIGTTSGFGSAPSATNVNIKATSRKLIASIPPAHVAHQPATGTGHCGRPTSPRALCSTAAQPPSPATANTAPTKTRLRWTARHFRAGLAAAA